MFFSKQRYLFLLIVVLLFPPSLQAAWTEPASAPPGGNVGVPVYSAGGVSQTIDSSLTVGAVGTATTLQGAGSAIGVQGSSPQYAVYGATAAGAPAGYAGVFGTAADSTDFAGNFSGGAGIAIQGGTMPTISVGSYVQAAGGEIVSTGGYALGTDVVFNNTNKGLVWQRLDGQWLRGVYVNAGVLMVKGYGAGINFTDQNGNVRMTVSEAGAVAVGGSPVCLQSGSGCPAQTTPNLQAVTTAGNTTTQDATFGNYIWVGTGNRVRVGEIYGNNGLHTVNTMQFNSAQAGTAFKWTYNNNDLLTLGSGDGLRVENGVGINMAPGSGAKLYIAQTASVEGLKIYQTGSSPKFSPISAVDSGGGDVFRVTQDGDVKLIRDIYFNNNKSLRVDDIGANTTLYLGNYGESGTFAYGSGKTASLYAEGDVRGNQLCMQGDCKASWAAITGSIGSGTANQVAKWTGASTLGNSSIYDNGSVAIGATDTAGFKLYVNNPGGFGLGVVGGSAFNNGLTVTGGLTINGSNLTVSTIQGPVVINGGITGNLSLTGNIVGPITVTGGDYNTATIKGASGKNLIGESGSDVLINSGSNKHTGNVWIEGANFVVFNTTTELKNDTKLSWDGGQVRIGPLVASGYKLDVNGQINTNNAFCINGNCKSSWWGPTGPETDVPFQSATPDGQRVTCPAGMAMVGIVNSSPAKLICRAM